MKMLDLFSGTGGASQAFVDRGHEVLRIDNDGKFWQVGNTLVRDVLDPVTVDIIGERGPWDVIWASPPCQAFSLAATGTHMRAISFCRCGAPIEKSRERWLHIDDGYSECDTPKQAGEIHLYPKTPFGELSVRLVEQTMNIIDLMEPAYWWMENPNGGMVHFVPRSIPRVQVTYCQYGESRMKLTSLWGNWPTTWTPRPRCKNGDSCHESAPRGAKTGTQGLKGAAARAAVPYGLSLEICQAVEAAL